MGVPSLFRWLSTKYPEIVVYASEDPDENADLTKPNPNNLEFDNLYLDMNAIIHPCSHPDNKTSPKDTTEMMLAIFDYIDRVFSLVRPRKLLYMAVDGVAPRAKMNQQRSRRFRAAKELSLKAQSVSEIREYLRDKGYDLELCPERLEFDSNCISPGTQFMDLLSSALRHFIYKKCNQSPAWKKIRVILSTSSVPGEGEHKIMDFIRKQRGQSSHNPNTRHCIFGADADLIMLGLATHEPHFTILREEFIPNKPKPCDICGQFGHSMKECKGLAASDVDPGLAVYSNIVRFIFVPLHILRGYLSVDIQLPNCPIQYDFERIIDDWVFICFFVGNDFLPHLPSLDIRENAIPRLVEIYKSVVYKIKGYLTDSGHVNLAGVQEMMTGLGHYEDDIFKSRRQKYLFYQQRQKIDYDNVDWRTKSTDEQKKSTSEKRRSTVLLESDPKLPVVQEVPKDAEDNVRLWEEGWKDRYYLAKFSVPGTEELRKLVSDQYAIGLCWVLLYYYQGCPSWSWYYPYNYSPFASDFKDLGSLTLQFDRSSEPYRPLEQLMAILPPRSGLLIPPVFSSLMTDPLSPILDFYPTDFEIDMNGKRYSWMGVALLPFIDEKRLLETVRAKYDHLDDDWKLRNLFGYDELFIGCGNKAFEFMTANALVGEELVDPSFFDGMTGYISPSHMSFPIYQNIPECPYFEDILGNSVFCVKYECMRYSDDTVFSARLLPGAQFPKQLPALAESRRSRIDSKFQRVIRSTLVPYRGKSLTARDTTDYSFERQTEQKGHHQYRDVGGSFQRSDRGMSYGYIDGKYRYESTGSSRDPHVNEIRHWETGCHVASEYVTENRNVGSYRPHQNMTDWSLNQSFGSRGDGKRSYEPYNQNEGHHKNPKRPHRDRHDNLIHQSSPRGPHRDRHDNVIHHSSPKRSHRDRHDNVIHHSSPKRSHRDHHDNVIHQSSPQRPDLHGSRRRNSQYRDFSSRDRSRHDNRSSNRRHFK